MKRSSGSLLPLREMLPAGIRPLPYRSNTAEISRFAFEGRHTLSPRRREILLAGRPIRWVSRRLSD